MDLLNRTFSVSEVAGIAGVSAASIRNWDRQGVMLGADKISGGGSAGRHRRYHWTNVAEIAVVGALIGDTEYGRLGGMSVEQAFQAARLYAHTNTLLQVDNLDPVDGRQLGFPFYFEVGQTFLVIEGEQCEILLSKDQPGRLHCIPQGLVSPPQTGDIGPSGMVVLNLTRVFRGMCNRMGLDYREVLSEVYPEVARNVG